MPAPEKVHGTGAGSPPAENTGIDSLFSLVYEELRRLASFVRRDAASATVNSTALVHEAWLKLKGSQHLKATSVAHFKSIAAKAMRQVLVDEARKRNAQKRGGGEGLYAAPGLSTEEMASCDYELIALDEALEELSRLNSRQAHIVECRFFAGLTVSETAELLDVSESAVERDWRAAKARLAVRIRAVE